MGIPRKNFERGMTRLLVALVPVWLLYWCLWVPGQVMDANTRSALARGAALDERGWATKWWDIVAPDGDAWLFLFVAVGVPIALYLFLRLLIFTTYWVANGFFRDSKT